MSGNENAKSVFEAAQRVTSPTPRRRVDSNMRATLRYALHTEVAFSWTGDDGSPKDGRGQTRDVSQKGAYVLASSYPPRGSAVKMSISLPPAIDTGRILRMEAQGRVVRVDMRREPHGSVRFGFAVSNEQVILCAG
jgi:hypothetical protein